MRKTYTPRAYQIPITDYILSNNRCAIWSFMGSGKTVATLTAVDALQYVEDGLVLVIAPLRVATTTWPEEVLKWEHLRGVNIVPITGTEKQRLAAIQTPSRVYTTNFEQLPWLVSYWGDKWPYATVVIDESTKIKGFRTRQGTQRAKALARVAHTKIRRLVELTGTPSPNGLKDLWGQIWFLDAGARLGKSFTAFSERWFRTGYDGFGIEPLAHAQREIQSHLQDVCLTIDAKDYFDLAEPIRSNRFVDLPIRARKHYRDMEKEFFIELDSGHQIEAFNAAARSQKLLQMANGAMYVDETGKEWSTLHDAKIEALDEIAEETNGAPILVAYNFKSDLVRILKAFPKARVLDKDPETIRAWNAGKIPMLVAHPSSAGHGLNLQDGGNILVYFGHNWNLEERLQIAERIGPARQFQAGYNRPVFEYNILTRDTIDEVLLERLRTKKDVQDLLLAAMNRRKKNGRLSDVEQG